MRGRRRISTASLGVAAAVPFAAVGVVATPAQAATYRYVTSSCFQPGEYESGFWRLVNWISDFAIAPRLCNGNTNDGWITTTTYWWWSSTPRLLGINRNGLGQASSSHVVNKAYSVLPTVNLASGNKNAHRISADSNWS